MLFLRHLLLSWAANAVVLAVVALAFGSIDFDGVGSLLGAAALFGVLNTLLKPILRLVTLPAAVITLGLVWFPISMLMLKLTDWLVPGFHIHGVAALFWATVVVWAVNVVVDLVGWNARRRARRASATALTTSQARR